TVVTPCLRTFGRRRGSPRRGGTARLARVPGARAAGPDAQRRAEMDSSAFRDAVYQIHKQGRERGHYFLTAEDERFTGRTIHVGGRRLLSFGSCSYLGLELDPRVVE